MDCPNCAKPVDPADVFCKHCGGRLDEEKRDFCSAAVSDMAAEFRNQLVDQPNDADALYNVGLASLYSGQYGAAADAFREVTRLLPDEASGYEKLAVALAKLRRRDEALEQARKAHRLDPESRSIGRLVRALGG